MKISSFFSDSTSVYFLWVSPLFLINKKCTSHFFRETANENEKNRLKGVFAKNERGYRLTSKIFDGDLILLLSVASIKRKLLKTTHTEERSVHTNSESCNIQLGSWNNQFNSKQIIQILQTIIFGYFSTHSYKVNI